MEIFLFNDKFNTFYFMVIYIVLKEGNIIFDALSIFDLQLYDIRYMVKDYSDSERGMQEGNVLFNDTLNTFCLRLCGVRHMVKDHSDSKPAAATWVTLSISS